MRFQNLRPTVVLLTLEDPQSVKIVHFIEKDSDDKIRKAIVIAVMTVRNRMHDAIWTAMDSLVKPGVEMAVSSITESSGRRPSSVVQNPYQTDLLGVTQNTPLMSASSLIALNFDQDRNQDIFDQTRNVENFEDGDFPALRPNYDRRTHAHRNSLLHVKLFSLFFKTSRTIIASSLSILDVGPQFIAKL